MQRHTKERRPSFAQVRSTHPVKEGRLSGQHRWDALPRRVGRGRPGERGAAALPVAAAARHISQQAVQERRLQQQRCFEVLKWQLPWGDSKVQATGIGRGHRGVAWGMGLQWRCCAAQSRAARLTLDLKRPMQAVGVHLSREYCC